tara:strand:+ start:915 stop:1274 length:360 start_codon:yes stop_codon:yes gene_type:complete
MDNFRDISAQHSNYKKTRENKYKLDSKERLTKIVKKKIQTTMIGALSSIEENFGFLWTNEDGELTNDQKIMKDLYQKVRSEILDKGNNQARNIDAELSQYEIEWLKYSIQIPVMKPKEE